MQSTTDGHHQTANTLLPQADAVFDEATARDPPVDRLDPPPAVSRLVGHVLLPRQCLAAGCLDRHQDVHLGKCEGQEAQILQQPAPSRSGRGRGLGHARIMDAASTGCTAKEDREQRIHQQDIFDGVVLLLAAPTCGLYSRVLGADDTP